MLIDRLSTEQRDALLVFLLRRVTTEQRHALMAAQPLAYATVYPGTGSAVRAAVTRALAELDDNRPRPEGA